MFHNDNAPNERENITNLGETALPNNDMEIENIEPSNDLTRFGDVVTGGLDFAEKSAKAIGHEARGLGLVSNLAEIGNAILQDPSPDTTERLACGTATGLTQVGLNAALTAGAVGAGTAMATPYAGVAMGIAAQPLIQKIVQPYGQAVSEKCHDFFTWLREPKKAQEYETVEALLKKENPALLEYFEQEKRRELRYEQEKAGSQVDPQHKEVEKQSSVKNIFETLSSYISVMPSAKAAPLEANQEIAAEEHINDIQNREFGSLTYPRRHALDWLNQHAGEINRGQFEKSQVDEHINKTITQQNLTPEQATIYSFYFTKTLARHLQIKNDVINVDVTKIGKALTGVKATKESIKTEISSAQDKISSKALRLEKAIQQSISKQTELAKNHFQKYNSARQIAAHISKKNIIDPALLKNIDNLLDWSQGIDTVGSGLVVAGRLCHNKQLVQLGQVAMGASSIMKGLVPMMTSGFKSGLTFGNVGLILGGINTVFSCFDRSDNQLGEALQAIMQQLQFISKQIYNLHQDMREQFDRVFKVLGKIHYDMLKHFMELHRETKDIKLKLVEIRESLQEIHGAIAGVSREIAEADRRNQTFHYTHLDAEWVKATEQCKSLLGTINLKSLKEQHCNLLAALNTTHKLKARARQSDTHFDNVIAHSLNQTFSNAEENIGFLFAHFSKDKAGKAIYEPHAFSETASQSIALFHSFQQSNEYKAMPEKIFNDHQELLKSGQDIIQCIEGVRQPNFIQGLFADYKQNASNVMQIIQAMKLQKENELNDARLKEINHQLEQQYNDFIQQSIDQIEIKIIGGWYTKGGYGLRRPICRGDEGNGISTAQIYASNYEKKYVDQRKQNIIDQFNRIKNTLCKEKAFNKENIHISFDQGISIKGAHRLVAIIKPMPNQSFNVLLPLRSAMTVPQEYYEAHALGLGQLFYYYEVNNDQTVLKISAVFQYKDNPILIKTWDLSLENSNQKLDNPPAYNKLLSPNEALWNYWVGGHFAANQHSIDLVTHWGNDKCAEAAGYHEYFCRQPVLAQHNGYYNCSNPYLFTIHTYNDQLRNELKKEITNLNQKLNDYLFEQSTSSRPNELASALRKLDISAKLLYGYLVLAFNTTMTQDTFLREMTALFNKDKIDDFLKNKDSIYDQLQVNNELLAKLEEYFIDYLQQTTIDDEYSQLLEQLDSLQQLIFSHEGETITWEEAEHNVGFNPESYSEGLEFGKRLAMSTIIMALNAAQFNDAANILSKKIDGELMMLENHEISPALKQGFVQALSLEVHSATAILLESEQTKAAAWLLKFSHEELWKFTNQQTSQSLLLTSFAENSVGQDEQPEKRRKTSNVTVISIFANRNNNTNDQQPVQQRAGLGNGKRTHSD